MVMQSQGESGAQDTGQASVGRTCGWWAHTSHPGLSPNALMQLIGGLGTIWGNTLCPSAPSLTHHSTSCPPVSSGRFMYKRTRCYH